MAFKIPVSVLVVIHSPEGRFLMLERALHPGLWQSVTGSIDHPEEPLWDTALREVREETGLDLRDPAQGQLRATGLRTEYAIDPRWQARYGPGVWRNTEHLFYACVPADAPVRLSPREHRAHRWLDATEAAQACFSPSNADAIRAWSAQGAG